MTRNLRTTPPDLQVLRRTPAVGHGATSLRWGTAPARPDLVAATDGRVPFRPTRPAPTRGLDVVTRGGVTSGREAGGCPGVTLRVALPAYGRRLSRAKWLSPLSRGPRLSAERGHPSPRAPA